jgi:catechol 2,3-dioxygenase-like lactoylglutathione lyase family enzyme
MVPFERLSHVSVTVSDLEKARRFYGGLLGLREIPRPDFGFPGVWYRLGGDLELHVIVIETGSARPAEPRPFDIRDRHFALWVADADETCERLRASGHPFHDYTSTPTGLRQLFVHDSDGNMVEFIGPTADARVRRMEREGR